MQTTQSREKNEMGNNNQDNNKLTQLCKKLKLNNTRLEQRSLQSRIHEKNEQKIKEIGENEKNARK